MSYPTSNAGASYSGSFSATTAGIATSTSASANTSISISIHLPTAESKISQEAERSLQKIVFASLQPTAEEVAALTKNVSAQLAKVGKLDMSKYAETLNEAIKKLNIMNDRIPKKLSWFRHPMPSSHLQNDYISLTETETRIIHYGPNTPAETASYLKILAIVTYNMTYLLSWNKATILANKEYFLEKFQEIRQLLMNTNLFDVRLCSLATYFRDLSIITRNYLQSWDISIVKDNLQEANRLINFAINKIEILLWMHSNSWENNNKDLVITINKLSLEAPQWRTLNEAFIRILESIKAYNNIQTTGEEKEKARKVYWEAAESYEKLLGEYLQLIDRIPLFTVLSENDLRQHEKQLLNIFDVGRNRVRPMGTNSNGETLYRIQLRADIAEAITKFKLEFFKVPWQVEIVYTFNILTSLKNAINEKTNCLLYWDQSSLTRNQNILLDILSTLADKTAWDTTNLAYFNDRESFNKKIHAYFQIITSIPSFIMLATENFDADEKQIPAIFNTNDAEEVCTETNNIKLYKIPIQTEVANAITDLKSAVLNKDAASIYMAAAMLHSIINRHTDNKKVRQPQLITPISSPKIEEADEKKVAAHKESPPINISMPHEQLPPEEVKIDKKAEEEQHKTLIAAANSGDPDSQFKLACLYEYGIGNLQEAHKYYKMAADQKHREALLRLWTSYEDGSLGIKDNKLAAIYATAYVEDYATFLSTASTVTTLSQPPLPTQRDLSSPRFLTPQLQHSFYATQEHKQDSATAENSLEERKIVASSISQQERTMDAKTQSLIDRANQGDADSQYELACLYETGKGGLPKDLKKALEYYHKAADRESGPHVEAVNRLWSAYENGALGIKDNRLSAIYVAKYFELRPIGSTSTAPSTSSSQSPAPSISSLHSPFLPPHQPFSPLRSTNTSGRSIYSGAPTLPSSHREASAKIATLRPPANTTSQRQEPPNVASSNISNPPSAIAPTAGIETSMSGVHPIISGDAASSSLRGTSSIPIDTNNTIAQRTVTALSSLSATRERQSQQLDSATSFIGTNPSSLATSNAAQTITMSPESGSLARNSAQATPPSPTLTTTSISAEDFFTPRTSPTITMSAEEKKHSPAALTDSLMSSASDNNPAVTSQLHSTSGTTAIIATANVANSNSGNPPSVIAPTTGIETSMSGVHQVIPGGAASSSLRGANSISISISTNAAQRAATATPSPSSSGTGGQPPQLNSATSFAAASSLLSATTIDNPPSVIVPSSGIGLRDSSVQHAIAGYSGNSSLDSTSSISISNRVNAAQRIATSSPSSSDRGEKQRQQVYDSATSFAAAQRLLSMPATSTTTAAHTDSRLSTTNSASLNPYATSLQRTMTPPQPFSSPRRQPLRRMRTPLPSLSGTGGQLPQLNSATTFAEANILASAVPPPPKAKAIVGFILIGLALVAGVVLSILFPPALLFIAAGAALTYGAGLLAIKTSAWWQNFKLQRPTAAKVLSWLGVGAGIIFALACPPLLILGKVGIITLPFFAVTQAPLYAVGVSAGLAFAAGAATLGAAVRDLKSINASLPSLAAEPAVSHSLSINIVNPQGTTNSHSACSMDNKPTTADEHHQQAVAEQKNLR